jgi:hypothetical protein
MRTSVDKPGCLSWQTWVQPIETATLTERVIIQAGFELLVPQTPDARRGISVMLVFDARLGLIRRATVLSLQGGHTLSGKAGQLQA